MEPDNISKNGKGTGVVAPEGEHTSLSSSRASETSSSSVSETEEGLASPLPNKRPRLSAGKRKYKVEKNRSDPRIETLMSQMSHITNYLTYYPMYYNNVQKNRDDPLPSTSTNFDSQRGSESVNSNTQFVTLPTQPQSLSVDWGSLNTEINERNLVPASDKERLSQISKLQQFETQAWKGIRYKQALQGCLSTPGFTGLKINDELCHFNKTKDYLASTELLLAGLSNKVLEQRQILRAGLQSLVDWASNNPQELSPSSLFDKITSSFGPQSLWHKNSETTMQVLCGKRSECIEVRRDRILKEVSNDNLKATLRNIPPSSEFLFSREALLPVIQSLGGSQVWLNTPNYIKDRKRPTTGGDNSYQNKKFLNKSKVRKPDRKFKNPIKRTQPFRQRYNNTDKSNPKSKED